MKRLVLAFVLTGTAYAQLWSGILDPTRAIDWTSAGIGATLPSASWTQCGSTIAGGGTAGTGTAAATVNSALAACAANHYVLLGSGFFHGGIHWTNSSVALRGAGADQTFIAGSGNGVCPGGFGFNAGVQICTADGSPNIGGSNPQNWTSGYAKGSTVLTFGATTGIVANQTLVFLDQCDDGFANNPCTGANSDTGNYFVCSDGNCTTEGQGTNAYRAHRAQIQIVVPTSVTSTQITIPSPGLHAPQWRTGQTPGAWIMQPVIQAGLENLSIDTTTTGSDGVDLWGCYKCWVSGVRYAGNSTGPSKSAIRVIMSAHTQIQNSYIFMGQSRGLDPYPIQFQITADSLVVNNIIQQGVSPIVLNGPSSGDVFAYNFTVLNNSGSQGSWSFWNHSSGIAYDLWEGNIAAGFANDDIHGTHNMITRHRNAFSGKESTNTSQLNPIFESGQTRYANITGNVLAFTGGLQTIYEADFNDPSNMVVVLGWGNTLPNDPITVSSAMLWGNWDPVTNAVRFCTANATPIAACTASERGETGPVYPGLTSPSTTLPSSFYYSSKPSWFGTIPWPGIGPEITGGNISNVGGHATQNPAMNCYLNVMSGPSNGSGSALTFNSDNCYVIVAQSPSVNVQGQIKMSGSVILK